MVGEVNLLPHFLEKFAIIYLCCTNKYILCAQQTKETSYLPPPPINNIRTRSPQKKIKFMKKNERNTYSLSITAV